MKYPHFVHSYNRIYLVCKFDVAGHWFDRCSNFKTKSMGLFDKLTGSGDTDGKVCKYCGQKKTLMSSFACSPGQQHKWVDPKELKNTQQPSEQKEEKESKGGIGRWLVKQATKPYKK